MEAEQPQPQSYLEKGVMLEPFVHQVGGHSCVLRFGDQTICKPLIPREHQFYKSLPTAIRRFTPQYRGVVSVSFKEDEEGNLCLLAYPLHNDPAADLENKDPSSDTAKILKWGKMMASSLLVDNQRHSHKNKENRIHKELKHNPWSLKCHQRHLQKMRENAKHQNQYKFILLENLNWWHTVPCVLDLKMGTQTHRDDASEEQKAEHKRRCQQSTSATIGVRIAGMQVYQSETSQQRFIDKPHGRKLNLPSFKEALFQFFHSGTRLRHELLSPVLRRLRDMKALEDCESYRFFSSSLLIIYDGAVHRKHTRRHSKEGLSEEDEEVQSEEEEEDQEQTETLSFSHSPSTSSQTSNSSSNRAIPHRPDSGYIFGLQNLITIISELENHSTEQHRTESSIKST